MVAIFIARDSKPNDPENPGEFERYKEGLKGSVFSDESMSSQVVQEESQLCKNSRDASIPGDLDAIAAEGNEDLRQDTSPIPALGVKLSEDFLLVVDASKSKDQIRKKLEDDVATANENSILDVENFLDRLMARVAGMACKSVSVSDVCLFVHWGGGTPLKLERAFRALIEKSSRYKDVKAFAVSTRLKERIDVTQSAIRLPHDGVSLRGLVSRCTFDLVRDTMTRYVTAYQLGWKLIDIDDDELNQIKEYLDYTNKTELKCAFLKQKSKAHLNSQRKGSTIKLNEAVAVSFAVLLREGMHHG